MKEKPKMKIKRRKKVKNKVNQNPSKENSWITKFIL